MESTEEKRTLGQVLDGLGVADGSRGAFDLDKYYTVGAIVLLKVIPAEGDITTPDLAVLWNEDLDYISRVGMVKIASEVIDAEVYLDTGSGDDED